MYTFKQLVKLLDKKLDYAFLLEYKNRKYVLTNLNNNTTTIFNSRSMLESFILD